MSTLQVDKINSFTPSFPVEINDSFKVTGSSQFTGSVNIQAPLSVNGTITGNTGSFEHSSINHLRIAGGEDVALGGISVGGNGTISCSSTAGIDTLNLSVNAAGQGGIQFGFGVGTAIDLASSNVFSTSFSRIQLKITLASQLADGAQVGPIRIHNTAINPQSNIITNIVGPVSGSANSSAISASIVSSFIQNNTCSIFINNETGQAIEDNTIFTCSILLFK